MSECIVKPEPGSARSHGWNDDHGLIELGPRYDGDYVIKGVHGEFYPCKPDIFEATYEALSDKVSGEKS